MEYNFFKEETVEINAQIKRAKTKTKQKKKDIERKKKKRVS